MIAFKVSYLRKIVIYFLLCVITFFLIQILTKVYQSCGLSNLLNILKFKNFIFKFHRIDNKHLFTKYNDV